MDYWTFLILRKLDIILRRESDMAIDLTAATAEIARNTSVEQSTKVLIQTLVTELQAASSSTTDATTQATLDSLVNQLTANDSDLAAAVAANTPAAPAQ